MTSILHTYPLYIISKYLPQNVVFSPMNQLIDFIFELKSKRTLETLCSTHSHFTFIKVLGLEEQLSSKACDYSMANFLSSNPQIKPPRRSKTLDLKLSDLCNVNILETQTLLNSHLVIFNLLSFTPFHSPQYSNLLTK